MILKQGSRVIYVNRDSLIFGEEGTIYDYIYYLKLTNTKIDSNDLYRLKNNTIVLVLFDKEYLRKDTTYEPFFITEVVNL